MAHFELLGTYWVKHGPIAAAVELLYAVAGWSDVNGIA